MRWIQAVYRLVRSLLWILKLLPLWYQNVLTRLDLETRHFVRNNGCYICRKSIKMWHVLKQMSDIILFTAKQFFLDACVMSRMCIEVYYKLGINTEQFQKRQTHKSLSQIYSIPSNNKDNLLRYEAYIRIVMWYFVQSKQHFLNLGAFEIVLYLCLIYNRPL